MEDYTRLFKMIKNFGDTTWFATRRSRTRKKNKLNKIMGLIGLASLITTLQLAFFTAASAFQCELETDVGLSGFQNGPGRDATYFDTA